MASVTVNKLLLKADPILKNFFVSELRLLNIPKNSFGPGPFEEFIDETIVRVLENLILNKALICHTEVTTYKYLRFFNLRGIRDYFLIDSKVFTDSLGAIERVIFDGIANKNSISSELLIDTIILRLLGGSEKVANPWRVIVQKVIQ